MQSLFKIFASRIIGFGGAKAFTNAGGGSLIEENEPEKPYDDV